MLAGIACATQPGFGSLGEGGTPTHTYRIHGLAYDGTPEPPEPGAGIEPASPDYVSGALPLSQPGPVEPSVAAAEAPLSVTDLIASYDWPVDEALRIAWCESNWQPTARNGVFLGVFQLWEAWFPYFGYDASQWADPAVNVRVAYLLWSMSGWAPWQCA